LQALHIIINILPGTTKLLVKKFGKVRKKFGKSSEILETGFSECSEISEILEIWKFQTFRKLRKNDVHLELRKLRNIRSDSDTDPKVRLKVRNAGPYTKVDLCLIELDCIIKKHDRNDKWGIQEIVLFEPN